MSNIVQHASRPVVSPSRSYDISYTLTDTYQSRAVPAPGGTASGVDLLMQPMVIMDSGASQITSGRFYTTWTEGTPSLYIPNFPSSIGAWYLMVNNRPVCSFAYGGLPSSYRQTYYEIVSVDRMTSFGNWRRDLLYSLTSSGEYIPEGYALPLTNGGNRSYIYVEATLYDTQMGNTLTVTNNTGDYSVPNSIYSNSMAAFYPVSSFAGRDEVTTQITTTETPQ